MSDAFLSPFSTNVKFDERSEGCNAISEGSIVDMPEVGTGVVDADGSDEVQPAMLTERTTHTVIRMITAFMDCFFMSICTPVSTE